jgi:Arm DNA-binding domain
MCVRSQPTALLLVGLLAYGSDTMRPMTVKEVAAITRPGIWWVSRNLYVQVTASGTKSWLFRYMRDGTAHGMGLGSLDLVTLAEARNKALVCRKMLLDGIDPLDPVLRTWTIPAERMKTHKMHVVPLSERVLELLAAMPRSSDLVFESSHAGKPIGAMGMSVVLRRMGCRGTVHGFRSSFRDWAAEQTGYPNHVMEMALAHAIGNGVEAAYRRGDLLEKRRELMRDWASYCSA